MPRYRSLFLSARVAIYAMRMKDLQEPIRLNLDWKRDVRRREVRFEWHKSDLTAISGVSSCFDEQTGICKLLAV